MMKKKKAFRFATINFIENWLKEQESGNSISVETVFTSGKFNRSEKS